MGIGPCPEALINAATKIELMIIYVTAKEALPSSSFRPTYKGAHQKLAYSLGMRGSNREGLESRIFLRAKLCIEMLLFHRATLSARR
jgi:hypothetical protein